MTFTATCTSSVYTWNFGDGQQAQGQSVQHVYAAGHWQPTLTTDGGTDTLQPVTSVAIVLTGPREAKYAQSITLHVSVTPAVPVEVRGHVAQGGVIHLRALSTAPYIALGGGARSAPLKVSLQPTISLSLRGSTVFGGSAHAVAVLHPASAGTVKLTVDGKPGAGIDTKHVHTALVVASSTPAPGWVAATKSLSVTVAEPTLQVGSDSPAVAELETDLAQLHYLVPGHSTTFSDELVDSIYAFQKVNHLPRTGIADAATWKALANPAIPQPKYKTAGLHVEVDKELQVLFIVRDGQITQISPVSTAGLPGRFTPGRPVCRVPEGRRLRPEPARHALPAELLHGRLCHPRQPVGTALSGVARVCAGTDVDCADDVHRARDRHARRRLLSAIRRRCRRPAPARASSSRRRLRRSPRA